MPDSVGNLLSESTNGNDAAAIALEGMSFEGVFDTQSREWSRVENFLSTGVKASVLDNGEFSAEPFISAKRDNLTSIPMVDTRIFSMMELCEYLVRMEGDLWQTIVAPLSVGLTEIRVKHKTKKHQQTIEDMLEKMDMRGFLEMMWLDIEVYGQAFPMEDWVDGEPKGLTLLNPKSVVIQPIVEFGTRPIFYIPDSKEEATALSKTEMFQRVLAPNWNEKWDKWSQFNGMLIKPDNVYHVHHFKHAHEVYAVPPLIRAVRSISTRMMLEEMRRSVIEGVKNQLFIWLLENPKAGEKALLQNLLKQARASRTGNFVWGSNLKVQQIIPQSIDTLLGIDTWQQLTLDIFRRLGIVLRTISGEAGSGGQTRDFEVDVQLYMRRIEFARKRVLAWVNRYIDRYAAARKIPWDAPDVSFSDMELQTKMAIKNEVVPLMGLGLLDIHSALEKAGNDPDVVIERLRSEKADGTRELVTPYPQFSQTATKPNGDVTKTESPQSPGRPVGTNKTEEDDNADGGSVQ
ncbi:MAG: hypothetical protein WC822_06770 [Candidatus Paceibacterota bacterium]|jgi:hypothetical protein